MTNKQRALLKLIAMAAEKCETAEETGALANIILELSNELAKEAL